MTKSLFLALTLLLAGCAAPATPAAPTIGPKGWFVGGTSYVGDVDPTSPFSGAGSASLRKVAGPADEYGYGALTQLAAADPYLGKRVRFSAMVRTEGVTEWAGLWLRIDGERRFLALDNMHDRPIAASTGWTRYECVLDVPASASGLAYGLTLSGGGQAWMDDAKLEAVGPEVATTFDPAKSGIHLEPFNTDFELQEAR